jgi:uncharacterized membrane protein
MKKYIKVPISLVCVVWAVGFISAIFTSKTISDFFTIALFSIGAGLSATIILCIIYNLCNQKTRVKESEPPGTAVPE